MADPCRCGEPDVPAVEHSAFGCRLHRLAEVDLLRARLAEVEAERNMWRRKFWEANGDKYIEYPTVADQRGEGDRAHGWFADRDPEDRNDMAWQPVLQLDGMCVSAEVWFSTEGECNAFIADNIIGQIWHTAAARGEGDRG